MRTYRRKIKSWNFIFATRRSLVLLMVLAAIFGMSAAQASAAFVPGNLLASVGNGLVKEFQPNGELVNTYDTGTASITTGSTFDAAGNLYVTDFDGNAVSVFDPQGTLTGTFGSGYNADPESIVFDGSGNAYVGQADGEGTILKFDPAGTLLETYSPEREDRGTDWVALASDECTLYYTSEGQSIKRYNVCTHEQLSDFADNLPGGAAYQLRFLPDGGILVADSYAILRLDKDGNIVQEYTSPNDSEWFNVQFSPGSSVFWAGDISTGNVAAFDLNSGVLIEEFNTSPATELAGLTVVGSPDYALKDSDGDGIPDEWEERGLRDAEGNMLVNLPAMGADPRHKDIFVQLDAMKGLALSPEALHMVTNAFNDAPVSNPDGTEGIRLHIDEGPASEMNPVTHATWGTLSEAQDSLPFKQTLGAYFNNDYDWAEFDVIKHSSFPSAREAVFHYALSINGFDAAGHTGLSRSTPGSDFLVALGHACNPLGTCVGPVKAQAGTFMHELGHNLGLHHGGEIDENRVPNYLSVMNYSFQFTGLHTSPAGVDYSRYESTEIPTQDENHLNENTGFNVPLPLKAALQPTLVWCPGHFFETVLMSGPVDFNCNGNASEANVSTDIHDTAESPSPYNTLGPLVSYSDWSDLWYRGGAVGGNGLGSVLPEITEDDEPPMHVLGEAADSLVPPPTGSTGNATGITASVATLHGDATPNGEETTVYFQYGPTVDYDSRTVGVGAGSAHADVAVSADLTSLSPNTTYHYQEVIETPTHLLYGTDESFTTQAESGPPTSTPQPQSVPATEPAAEAHHCVVPHLRGKQRRRLAPLLRAAHCTLGRIKIKKAREKHGRKKSPRVVHQSAPPGTELPDRAPISVILS